MSTCPRCAGRDEDCELCSGRNEVEHDTCAQRCASECAEILHAYADWQANGTLPTSGGMQDQAVTLVTALRIIDGERAAIARSEEDVRKALGEK